MLRPCFLVVDREFAGSISTRKLVIETAKFNVITAYSGQEAIATLRKFPNLDAVVLDAAINDLPAPELVDALRQIQPGLPIITVRAPGIDVPDLGDHILDTFDPTRLIALLKRLFPEAAATVDQREAELEQRKVEQPA